MASMLHVKLNIVFKESAFSDKTKTTWKLVLKAAEYLQQNANATNNNCYFQWGRGASRGDYVRWCATWWFLINEIMNTTMQTRNYLSLGIPVPTTQHIAPSHHFEWSASTAKEYQTTTNMTPNLRTNTTNNMHERVVLQEWPLVDY